MTSSQVEVRARARSVAVTDDSLVVDLVDGRALRVPLSWYPRLAYATREERSAWRIIGRGEGIHWQDIDEDIDVESLLEGRASGESRRSLERWLAERQRAG